jgi:hypothetical protein
MRGALFIFSTMLAFAGAAQSVPASDVVMYSKFVKDSFRIILSAPKKLDSTKNYHLLLYLDGGINSGKAMAALATNKEHKKLKSNTLFVGIAHMGNYRQLRPRDFIPPKWKNGKEVQGKDQNYGHADKFYLFLANELLPLLEQQYYCKGKKAIVGHSFGGLFTFYCLLREHSLFDAHFALSPSLWVDNSNFFEREKFFHSKNKWLSSYLYMACGTLEFANYVLPTNRRMYALLQKRDYKGLQFDYEEKQWANHNSHVQLTLKGILNKLEAKWQ